ncbi:Protein phosphatase 2C family protein [Cryptosporidium meleagridis]|uniref:Protein phosphatase 2C family protein n=1 Tax=Cryptosporidium meleagridis TaxID=93969 RepID=A0A2P4Z634_9CRYT|nr:Protein phosphatase 2C family protein [Cryptosporidium meleagridis]
MKFKIFTKSRSNSRIHTPKLIEESFFDIYKDDLFKNQLITISAVLESDDNSLEEDEEDTYYNNNYSSDENSKDLWIKLNELKIEECTDDDCNENKLISKEIQSNNSNSDFLNYKELLDKINPEVETSIVKSNEEDEINQLRTSIFKKLDLLENEIMNIRNHNIIPTMKNELHQSNVDINVQDILSNIGKQFIDGVSNIIETGHSKIFKKYSLKLNEVKSIINEYNQNEMNIIINQIESQSEFLKNNNNNIITYETLNNVFQYDTPIKGIGYWYEQGMSNTMDDRWFISKLSSGSFFGILDGYNGSHITTKLESLIVTEFDTNLDNEICLNKNNLVKIFLKTILSIDKKILVNSPKESLNTGSGLISCFIFYSKADNQYVLFSCNLGNCKGFLSRNNEIIKFHNENFIVNSAIGFGFYKPPLKNKFEVDNVPQVISIDLLSDSDKFIIIATDSIWKVFQEEELNDMATCILNEIYSNYPTLNKQIISTIISHSIVTESLLRGVTDNQICMVVLLN